MGRAAAPLWLFALLCLLWGSNWLVLKLALASAPPFAFAAARSILAGAIMAAIAGPREVVALLRAAPGRVVATALLTNTLTYAGLYWGTAHISTGLAAIVNNALMPLGLFAFGLALGEETFSRRRVAGIVLGALGLALLFARRSGASVDAAGIAAVAAGTLAYCLGSVGSRPLLRQAAPMTAGGAQMLVGGIALAPLAALEGDLPSALASLATPVAFAGLLWMAVAGGVVGATIYLRLMRDWGPTRSGMYAFVAPLVATVLGAVVLGERLGALEAAGGALMLAAAGLVLPAGRRAVAAAPQQDASR
jgi:drug/metabolite transporter (DMT)-like permease